ncbi:MAG: hypothetical protein AB7O45_09825 [Alphaproteobacteria bacterium]
MKLSLDRLRFWRLDGRRRRAAGERRVPPAPAAAGVNGTTMIVVRGLGGHLEVDGHIIRLKRGGPFAFILSLLGYQNAFLEKSIWIDRLSTIDIVRPFGSLDYIRFCYPGSPNITGRPIQDALADNALLLNPFDHREFYTLKSRLEALIRAIGDPHTLPGKTS